MTQVAKATKREWLGLAVIALPCLLYSMDLTVLNLAVPQITADLRPSSAQMLWIVDIYGFLLAGSLITMGTIGDRIGRRRLLLIGAAAFGVVSVLTAFAQSPASLIAARGLLGIAAATLAPSTLSLIRNMFDDPSERARAIAIWVASFSAGAAIGPVVGGALLEHFWWGSVFLVPVPIMVLLLAIGPTLLPEYRDPAAGRLDVMSALESIASILAIIYGLKIAAQGDGSPPWVALLAIAIGLSLGVLFLRRQRSLREPLIDLSVFTNTTFSAALTINVLDFFMGFGSLLFITQYLQSVSGLSPLRAGLWTVPWALASVVGSVLTPLVAARVRPGFAMAGGLLVGACGFAAFTQVGGAAGFPMVVVGSVLLSLGFAPLTTVATDLIVGSVPAVHAGMASSISETSSELGGALGIAVLGSIGTFWYRSHVASALSAHDDIARAAARTIGEATAVAANLREPVSREVLHVAREAFAGSFVVVGEIGAALAVATAVVCAVLLRHVPATSNER
jgi:MFS transporter, DHA2 family, multidrug resistance protein